MVYVGPAVMTVPPVTALIALDPADRDDPAFARLVVRAAEELAAAAD